MGAVPLIVEEGDTNSFVVVIDAATFRNHGTREGRELLYLVGVPGLDPGNRNKHAGVGAGIDSAGDCAVRISLTRKTEGCARQRGQCNHACALSPEKGGTIASTVHGCTCDLARVADIQR